MIPALAGGALIVVAITAWAWSAGSTTPGGTERTATLASAAPSSTDVSVGPRPTTTRPTATEGYKTTSFEGFGTAVIRIARPDGKDHPVLVKATHPGASKFVLQTDRELLVNEVGPYDGTTYLRDVEATELRVVTDGPWHVDFRSAFYATPFDAASSASGRGDDVLFFTGKTGVAEVRQQGDGELSVEQIVGSAPPAVLVDGLGTYTWRVRIAGPSIVVVSAVAPWTIDVG